MKGIFEFEIGEPKRKIGFKFGTMAMGIAEEKEGTSLKVILTAIAHKKVKVMTLLHLMYGAAVQYADHKKIPADFSVSDVSDWIEEIGLEQMQTVITEGLNQYAPKNSQPPVKTGEMTETTTV